MTQKKKKDQGPPPAGKTISHAGAEDIREVARVIARVGSSRAVFLRALAAVFAPPTPQERRWLHEAWKEAASAASARSAPRKIRHD